MRDELFLKQMGAKIKAIRNKRGITVRELSKLSSLDCSALSRIETGQKDSHILTLKVIADALEVDVKRFI